MMDGMLSQIRRMSAAVADYTVGALIVVVHMARAERHERAALPPPRRAPGRGRRLRPAA